MDTLPYKNGLQYNTAAINHLHQPKGIMPRTSIGIPGSPCLGAISHFSAEGRMLKPHFLQNTCLFMEAVTLFLFFAKEKSRMAAVHVLNDKPMQALCIYLTLTVTSNK